MNAPPAPAQPFAIPQVTPVPGSRLEQLMAMRETARAAAKDAADRLKAIEAGIMTEAAAASPGTGAVDITGSPHWPALRLRWHQGDWYVPAGTLRTSQPLIWDALKQQKKGHWQLHELSGP